MSFATNIFIIYLKKTLHISLGFDCFWVLIPVRLYNSFNNLIILILLTIQNSLMSYNKSICAYPLIVVK